MAGRTSYLRAHITNECAIASSEVRATVFKQSSKIEKPAALAEDMTAVSNNKPHQFILVVLVKPYSTKRFVLNSLELLHPVY